jgi:hypothetical protein
MFPSMRVTWCIISWDYEQAASQATEVLNVRDADMAKY